MDVYLEGELEQLLGISGDAHPGLAVAVLHEPAAIESGRGTSCIAVRLSDHVRCMACRGCRDRIGNHRGSWRHWPAGTSAQQQRSTQRDRFAQDSHAESQLQEASRCGASTVLQLTPVGDQKREHRGDIARAVHTHPLVNPMNVPGLWTVTCRWDAAVDLQHARIGGRVAREPLRRLVHDALVGTSEGRYERLIAIDNATLRLEPAVVHLVAYIAQSRILARRSL